MNLTAIAWLAGLLSHFPVEQAVLEHAVADVLHLDHVQVAQRVRLAGLRILRLEHLRQLVVGHRRGRVDLVVQEQVHVERLLHDRHALVLVRAHAVLDEGGEELELVAAEPVGDLLALHARNRRDPGVLPGQLRHARPREDLCDVHQIGALVTGGQQARQPVDAELRLAARDDLLGDDVRAAVLERDVEALLGVEAVALGGVVAGELRLRDPTPAAA